MHFDKITFRIEKLCYNLNMEFVDPVSVTKYFPYECGRILHLCKFGQAEIAMKVINGLYPGVTTVELDNLAAEICATLATKHPDYATLAARIAISNLHKETKEQFSGEFIICHVGWNIQ